MTDGLVSIVIPAYNPGRYLSEALESALAQTYEPVEAIVVDDGSTEDLAATVRRWPSVRLLRQANLGVSAARNTGARSSEGQYLVFLDADDRLLPDAVSIGVARLGRQHAAAFAAGLCQLIGSEGEPMPFRQQPEFDGEPYAEMLRWNFIWNPAQVMYRREAFEASGGFDSSVNACADYDLYLRLTRLHPVVCHRQVVVEYRFHAQNMSADKALMLRSALTVIDRQWPQVRNDASLRRAYWQGRRFWQDFFGSGLVDEIRACLKTPGGRRRAVRATGILLRHHPSEVFRQCARKLRRVALGLVGSAR